MKKFFSFLLSAAILFTAASCSQPDFEDDVVPVGQEVEVTFSADLAELGSRAGEGNLVDVVYFAAYHAGTNSLLGISQVEEGVEVVNGKATISTTLVVGKAYDFVFWAENEAANHYDINWAERSLSVNYGTDANDESRDAFLLIKNNYVVTADNLTNTFYLSRPFAQLNLGSSDADEKGMEASGIEITSSSLTTKAYNTLSLTDASVSGLVDVTFTDAELLDEALDAEGEKNGYLYLSMNYLLINEKEFVDVDVKFNEGAYTRKYTTIPVQRNYRTNILGTIITDPAKFDVELVPGFKGDLPNTDLDKLNLAAQVGGTVVLSGDVVLTEPLIVKKGVEMVIVLNGYTISQEKAQDGGYSMIQNNGILTIQNAVSRAASNGTIKYSDTATLSGDVNYASNTIINNGYLTIEEGVEVINASNSTISQYGYPHAIDNNANLTINGGVFTNEANYSTLRIWCTKDNNTKVTINGGTFNGSIDLHNVNAESNKGTLTINGGTFNADTYTKSAVRLLGFGVDVDEINAYIKGGTFNGLVKLSNFVSGEFNSQVFYITGGTYANDVTEFVVDGYSVVKNGELYTVVEGEFDVVVTNSSELDSAIKDGKSGILLAEGTYIIPDTAQRKTLTLAGVGNPENTIIEAQNDGAAEGNGDYCFDSSTVTFQNLSINIAATYFPGFPRMKGTFKNCIINGVYTTYDSSSFEDCTFNISGDFYNVWTWGAINVTFNNCVFNCDGKSILLYGEVDTTLTMNNCTFNDNGGLTDLKAAIEIGNDYGRSYNLVVNNATVNGFEINDKGINTNTTLWANKNSMSQEKLNVVVDGVDVY